MYLNDVASLVLMFTLFFIFVIEICLIFWLRNIRLKDRTQFRFCQIRRDMIRLVYEGKLPVSSPAFSSFYGLSSYIIHYIDDYRFDSAMFIKAISKQPDQAATSKLGELINEVKQYDNDVQQVSTAFFSSILTSLDENCLVLKLLISSAWIHQLSKRLFAFLGDRFKNIGIFEKFRYQIQLANKAQKWQQAFS